MPDHLVKLHYRPNPDPKKKPIFAAEPPIIKVRRNQTIAFRAADDSVSGTIQITFRNPEMFSAPGNDGTGEVTVTGKPIKTSYTCALLGWDGVSIAESTDGPGGGGEILPDPPPSA